MTIKEFEGFNKNHLFERMLDDEELVKELLELYLKDTPKKLKDIEKHLSNNNLPEVHLLAHSIKGASANVCMEFMKDIASNLEIKAKEADQNTCKKLFSDLTVCFNTIKSHLNK